VQALGASSVLATLWAVEDESTAQVMGEFYKAYAGRGIQKIFALQAAQISLLRSSSPSRKIVPPKLHAKLGIHTDSFLWASFILSGNPI
jgi:CHAT domain-containing protein